MSQISKIEKPKKNVVITACLYFEWNEGDRAIRQNDPTYIQNGAIAGREKVSRLDKLPENEDERFISVSFLLPI